MGKKLKGLLKDEVPGPGMYNIEQKRPKSAKSRLSRSARMSTQEDTMPGPGMYNLTKDLGKSTSFTRSEREKSKEPQTPGPGSYHIPSWNDDTGRTILERHDEKLKENFPGPGMYDIKLATGLSYSVSGHATIDYHQKERINNPGPTHYEPNSEIVLERKKGGKIGKSTRDKTEGDQYPGPGHYKFYDVNADLKGFTMGQRYELDTDEKNPAPNYYDNQTKSKGYSYSIGKEKKISSKGGEAPGPGQYSLQAEISNGMTIPKSTKIIKYKED